MTRVESSETLGEVVSNHENRASFLAQCPEQSRQKPAAMLIQAGIRLVQEQESRLVQQSASERQALLHPARKPANHEVARIGETDPDEHGISQIRGVRQPVEPGIENEVLPSRQLIVEEGLMGNIARFRPSGCGTIASKYHLRRLSAR